MQNEPSTDTLPNPSSPTFLGSISQLNAKKPLSSFFTYNLLIYSDGLLFTQESLGEVIKTAGAMGAGANAGIGGVLASRNYAQKIFQKYSDAASVTDRSTLINNPKNHWYPKSDIASVQIKKGWFVDKLTVILADGTTLRCGSKRGYKQRDNMLNLMPEFMPQTTVQ